MNWPGSISVSALIPHLLPGRIARQAELSGRERGHSQIGKVPAIVLWIPGLQFLESSTPREAIQRT